jgi:hypothetical protein
MAKAYGVEEIPQPAGGCLLTDPGYSARLKDLWDHDPEAGGHEINLLRVGRHFRPDPACKIIVGRDERECGMLETFQRPGDTIVYLKEHQGPTVLVRGRYGPGQVRLAGSLAVRYGDVPGKAPAEVVVERRGGVPYCLEVECAREADYAPLRVGV